jgi:hypothetical protein
MFHVEHTKPMRITSLVIVCGLLILAGCKQADPNPELHDPIFIDLKAKPEAFKQKAEEQKKKIEELKKKVAGMTPRDPDQKRSKIQIYDMERALVNIEQTATYYDIRVQQRLEFDRKAYAEAFNAGKEWPDPAEFEEYQSVKKLRESPRDWDKHIPKLTKYLPPSPDKKEKPKEAAKEHKE